MNFKSLAVNQLVSPKQKESYWEFVFLFEGLLSRRSFLRLMIVFYVDLLFFPKTFYFQFYEKLKVTLIDLVG